MKVFAFKNDLGSLGTLRKEIVCLKPTTKPKKKELLKLVFLLLEGDDMHMFHPAICPRVRNTNSPQSQLSPSFVFQQKLFGLVTCHHNQLNQESVVSLLLDTSNEQFQRAQLLLRIAFCL
jgi:light-regulated signal transduction histidine kinase (bacteriophytochrome)